MKPELIFVLQLVLGYVPWLLICGAYVWPRLWPADQVSAQRAIAALHSFRFFGLVFLLPGVVGPNLPAGFAELAAYGDFATGVLAMLALLTVRMRPLFWVFVVAFNVAGAADILVDYVHGVQFGLPCSRWRTGRGLRDPHALRAAPPDYPRDCPHPAVSLPARGGDAMSIAFPSPLADAWFAGGRRLDYDLGTRTIDGDTAHLKIFVREEGEMSNAVTFLPGYPDGSFGWSGLIPYLPDARQMPKLFFDYVGMGDSDKPKDYAYSTAERADLVEALWQHLGVQSTTLVAFDFSSLVVVSNISAGASSGPDEASRHVDRGSAASSSSTVGCSPTGIRIPGTPRPCSDDCQSGPGVGWAAPRRIQNGDQRDLVQGLSSERRGGARALQCHATTRRPVLPRRRRRVRGGPQSAGRSARFRAAVQSLSRRVSVFGRRKRGGSFRTPADRARREATGQHRNFRLRACPAATQRRPSSPRPLLD